MKPFETLTNRGQMLRLRPLALDALSGYPIPDPQLTALWHGDNTTFRVDAADGHKYVIRIRRPPQKTADVVRSEMQWLAALRADTELLVPEPVPRIDGEYVTWAGAPGVPEPRLCVVLRWMDGRFVNRRLTPRHLHDVGVLMARLHDHADRFERSDGFIRGAVDNLYGKPAPVAEGAARRRHSDPEDEAEALEAVAEVSSTDDVRRSRLMIEMFREAQQDVGYDPDVFGLIHADLHQENYLFQKGRIAAIDFDDCGFGHHLYDMAVTLRNVSFRDGFPALRAAFLEGYRSLRELSPEHEAHLRTFVLYRDLQIMLWAIETRDQPLWRDRWRQEVEWAMEDIGRHVGFER